MNESIGSGCGSSSQYITVEEDQALEVRHAVDIFSAFTDGTWDGSAESISITTDFSGQKIQMIVGYVSDISSKAVVYTTSTGLPRDTCEAPAHAKIELSLETLADRDVLTAKLCSNNDPGSSEFRERVRSVNPVPIDKEN